MFSKKCQEPDWTELRQPYCKHTCPIEGWQNPRTSFRVALYSAPVAISMRRIVDICLYISISWSLATCTSRPSGSHWYVRKDSLTTKGCGVWWRFVKSCQVVAAEVICMVHATKGCNKQAIHHRPCWVDGTYRHPAYDPGSRQQCHRTGWWKDSRAHPKIDSATRLVTDVLNQAALKNSTTTNWSIIAIGTYTGWMRCYWYIGEKIYQ